MNIKLSILFILLFPSILLGQYRFSYLNINDGLVQNSITDIFQDSEGYMWFSTQDGISQYNGYEFINFNTSNTNSEALSDNYLWRFCEDKYKGIWVCSRNGLNRYDKNNKTWTKFFTNSDFPSKGISNQIRDVTIFDNNIYCVSRGTIFKDSILDNYPKIENRIVTRIKLQPDSFAVYSLFYNKFNNELFAIHSHGIYNLSTQQNYTIPGFRDNIRQEFMPTFSLDSTGFLFSNGTSIYRYDYRSKEITKLHTEKTAVIYGMEMVNNDLWVATNEGVLIFSKGKLIQKIRKAKVSNNGLSSNLVSKIFKDSYGKIWIGTSGNGLNIYNPYKDRFKYLSQEIFKESIIVRGMVQDEKNRLFVCGDQSFVIQLKNTNFKSYYFAQDNIVSVKPIKIKGFSKLNLTAVAIGFNNDVIVGSKGEGVFIMDTQFNIKKHIVISEKNRSKNVVTEIRKTRANEIWVTTYYGVYVLDENYEFKHLFKPYENGLESNYFLCVYEDSRGEIWLGSNTGFYHYLKKDNVFENIQFNKKDMSHSPGFNFISGFTDFGDDYLWVSTYGGGLSKMNLKTKTFEHYTTSSGLENNVCNGLVKDDSGHLWINTNKGISKFIRETESFINYDKSDGIHFNEFNLNSVYQNKHGQIFFGTPVGIVLFSPQDISLSKTVAPIVFTGLDINYKNSDKRLSPDVVRLYPEDRSVTFHFAGLSFNNSKKIKYQYKLEGYNTEWVATNSLNATYTSLPDGEFTFLVKTCNPDGVWSKQPKTLKVLVFPPFYKTWWFIFISFIVILTFVILIIRYLSQKKIKKRIEELKVQEQIHREKQRISRDLHDNIGAQITYLISSIDQESYQAKEQQHVFEGLSDKARNVMIQLRQTLWVISKEEISLEDFVDKIRDYSTRILEVANVNCSVSFNAPSSINLSPIMVSNLFRIIQEAQNNIIKHAKAKNVFIKLQIKNNLLILTVKDDGVGIESIKNLDDHFGIKNMQNRVADLGGNFEIVSQKGTCISITVPIKQGK